MKGSLLAFVWPRSRGGIRGGVARGHGMAVPAAGRCLRGGRAGGEVSSSGVPVVCRAAGVVVGLLASCPDRGRLPEDLRAAAALSAVPGEPCTVAGVHAGLAAGCGRDRRRGDRRGDWRRLRVRPAAARRAVPYTTARGWVRRFRRRAPELGAGFPALAVELGADAPPRARLAVTAAAEDDWGEAELEPGPGVAGPGLPWSMVPVPGIHGPPGAGLLRGGPASPVW
jgi:hypothetical protein